MAVTKTRAISALALLMAAFAALLLTRPEAPPLTQAELEAVECWFPVPEELDVQCSHLTIDPARGDFSLPVVLIRDHSPDHREDPLVYLSGGPGNSSFLEAANVEHWFYWAEIAKLSRDLIFVDQRGTGLSKPQYHCHEYRDFVRDSLADNLSLRQEQQGAMRAVEQCLKLMQTTGLSPRMFSTTHSAHDMQELMTALGYREWNVMGGSYGTRLALEWLRRYPDNIRSLVLDSVYPPDKGSLADWPQQLQQSFDFLWQACATGSLCEPADAELEAKFWEAMTQLRKKPLKFSVPLWEGDWPVDVLLNDHRFVGMIYTALYDDTLHGRIVEAINEVSIGEQYPALQRLVENAVNSELAPEFNPMVYLAVDCSESAPLTREAYELVREQYPQWSAYTDSSWDYDMCQAIPKRSDVAAFKQPVQSEVPALILSGGFDPVTPASWARDLAKQLPNSQHWHLDWVGHGVVASSACVHQSIRGFLDAPLERHELVCD